VREQYQMIEYALAGESKQIMEWEPLFVAAVAGEVRKKD
jgi:hypothetical protein